MMNVAASTGKRTIISLGGSIIVPGDIDVEFLKKFKEIITDRVALGDSFVIITGGGKTCRTYQAAAYAMGVTNDKFNVDWVGILATRLNGELVRVLFGDMAYQEVVVDYTMLPNILQEKPVIIGAGPRPIGSSTDKDAVLAARGTQATRIINLSNISVVYDKDPKTNPDAQPMHDMTWSHYRSIIPTPEQWTPGLNTPFDPLASKMAEESGIEVVVAKGTDTENLKKILNGEEFVGTTIRA